MKKVFKKGFTLAEVMIVLSVIGILAGILIPVANNSRPDENVMKFKKAHATLANVIHELVTSDDYYTEGDLGKKKNGDLVDGTNDGDYSYFCETFADNLSTKSINCKTTSVTGGHYFADGTTSVSSITNGKTTKTVTDATIATTKKAFDSICKSNAKTMQKEIETTDGVVYYSAATSPTFGGTNPYKQAVCPVSVTKTYNETCDECKQNHVSINSSARCVKGSRSIQSGLVNCSPGYKLCARYRYSYSVTSTSSTSSSNNGTVQFKQYTCHIDTYITYFCQPPIKAGEIRYFSPLNEIPAYIGDQNGFDIAYKIFCMDVDGFDETNGSENCDDVKDVCPFGYGIRADGKILNGERADEWLEKDFQKGKNDN